MGFPDQIDDGSFWLRRNHGAGTPSEFCFVGVASAAAPDNRNADCETRMLQCYHADFLRYEHGEISRRKIITGGDAREFWDAVMARGRKRTPLWIVAHNMPAVFTWLAGWRALRYGRLGFEWREIRAVDGCKPQGKSAKWRGLFIDQDPPVALQLWTERATKVFCVDLRNYFNAPLDKLAARLKRPLKPASNGWAATTAASDYARDESAVVRETFLRLVDEHGAEDQGTWGMTATSLAWRSFRHAHYKSNVLMHTRDDVKALERKAFMGGRVECFKIGKHSGPVRQIDVNGLYPWIMRHCDLPASLDTAWNMRSAPKIGPQDLTEDFIAHVQINSPTDTFPVRVDGTGLVFACGRFWTTLCGPELRRAADAGVVSRVGRWSKYKRENLFKPFIDYWTQRRAAAKTAGDSVGAAFAKQCAVSLFGRFGQRSHKWRSLTKTHDLPSEWRGLSEAQIVKWIWLTEGSDGRRISIVDFNDDEKTELRRVGNHWQVAEAPHEIPNSFVAIPAFITSYGREFMRSMIDVADAKETLYISTDSMIVTQRGFDRIDDVGLCDADKLGKFKLEAEGDSAEILTAHHYRVGEKRVSGNRSQARMAGSSNENGDVISDRLQTLIKTGTNATVKRRRVSINRQLTYRRGNVAADGTVTPLRLG